MFQLLEKDFKTQADESWSFRFEKLSDVVSKEFVKKQGRTNEIQR